MRASGRVRARGSASPLLLGHERGAASARSVCRRCGLKSGESVGKQRAVANDERAHTYVAVRRGATRCIAVLRRVCCTSVHRRSRLSRSRPHRGVCPMCVHHACAPCVCAMRVRNACAWTACAPCVCVDCARARCEGGISRTENVSTLALLDLRRLRRVDHLRSRGRGRVGARECCRRAAASCAAPGGAAVAGKASGRAHPLGRELHSGLDKLGEHQVREDSVGVHHGMHASLHAHVEFARRVCDGARLRHIPGVAVRGAPHGATPVGEYQRFTCDVSSHAGSMQHREPKLGANPTRVRRP
eukprot:IDg13492t1